MAYTQNHNQNCPCSLCYSLRGGGAGSTTVTTHLLGAVSMNNTERRLENEIHKVLQEELADSAIYQDSYAELTLKRHLQNTESRLSVLFHQALAEERDRVRGEIEKNNVQNLCHYDDRNPEYNAIMRELNDNRGRSDDCSCYNCFRGKDKIITDILSFLDSNPK